MWAYGDIGGPGTDHILSLRHTRARSASLEDRNEN